MSSVSIMTMNCPSPNVLDRLSIKPKRTAAATAPGMLPIPPTITTMKAFQMASSPMNGPILITLPMSDPDTAANAAPIAMVRAELRLRLIPWRTADRLSCEIARMARPVREWVRKYQSPTIMMTENRITARR